MTLTREDVVTTALALSDAKGVDALSLRSLARALGVQAPSLYTHVRSKADLLDALADRIMDEVITGLAAPDVAADWRAWLGKAARRLRDALLQHTDGARIVAGARTSLRRADFSESAITALLAAGVELREARLSVLAVERFTVGYVLEEQATAPQDAPPPDREALMARLPNVTAAILEYFQADRTVDDLFDDEIRVILRGSPR